MELALLADVEPLVMVSGIVDNSAAEWKSSAEYSGYIFH